MDDPSKMLGMAINLNLDLQNKADMWRDEFKRIRALAHHQEIVEICDRAMTDIRSKISLIDQREKVVEENARLRTFEKDAERLYALRELMGYIEDGSSETVKISQDDATRNFFISVGKQTYYGRSFSEVLDKTLKDLQIL